MKFNVGDKVMLKPDGSDNTAAWYEKYIGQVGRVEELHENGIDFWLQIEWNDGFSHFNYNTKDLIKVNEADNTELNKLFDELCEEI